MKQKILLLSPSSITSLGGVEQYNFFLKNKLTSAGYDVTNIYAFTGKNVTPMEDEICLGLSDSKSIISYLKTIRKLKKRLSKLLKQYKGSIVFLNSYFFVKVFSKSIIKKYDLKVVQIQHSNPTWINEYYTSNIIRKKLFKNRKNVQYLMGYPGIESIKELFPNVKKTFVVAPPINVKEIKTSTICKQKNIFWAGRFYDVEKNYTELIEIAKLNKDFTFNVYGDGPEKEIFLEKSKLVKNIKYHGRYSIGDLPKLYKNNFCALMTSKEEGFPLISCESAFNKTPLVMKHIDKKYFAAMEFFKKIKFTSTFDNIEETPGLFKEIFNNQEKYIKQQEKALKEVKKISLINTIENIVEEIKNA